MARLPRDPHYLREVVALTLACGVFVVWAVTQIAAVFFNRPVDGQVHLIMLTTVSALLGSAGLSAWRSGKNGNGNGS